MVRVDRLSVSPYLRCTHISLHLSVTSAVYNGAEVGLLVLLCSVFFFSFLHRIQKEKSLLFEKQTSPLGKLSDENELPWRIFFPFFFFLLF